MGDPGFNAKSWTARLGLLIRGGKERSPTRHGEITNHEEKKGARKLSKQPARLPSASRPDGINELGEHEYDIFSDAGPLAEQVDGIRDHTEMLHGLAHRESQDSMVDMARKRGGNLNDSGPELAAVRKRREEMLASVPLDIWILIGSYLGPSDRTHLSLTNKTLFANLGTRSLRTLNLPENHLEKIRCLRHIDRHLPSHLLCFLCARYHLRTNPGAEKPSSSYTQNPVFICPASKTSILPRTRLAHPRTLPYAFVQLVMRAAKYGPAYGISPETLSRGWKDHESGWTHRTTYQVNHGRLLLRVRSQAYAPPSMTPAGMRHLLYERGEYMPYFSVCAHWREGVLMDVCKCALSHVPEPPRSLGDQLKKGPHWAASQMAHSGRAGGNSLCRECVFCQSARRCPRCPSEYLVKVSLVEDKEDPVQRFKYAIVVTRWCDLGDGSGPGISPEWDAINRIGGGYESFEHVGRRSMMGVFESKFSGVVPGAGLMSMHPVDSKGRGEDDTWY
ncbi:hypothetical protein VM1G_07436 [Cytospora mali]|uniref:F-box domain-containing protein n=1 Tax=Cytospora mali TaxID=578113 RepID=A0A194W7S9_CYTMA|nr:hypothetical protein VM1G_07436 [Valsa mali]